MLPPSLPQEGPYKVPLVKALHDDNNGVVGFAIQPRIQSVVVPLLDMLARCLRVSILGLLRIVDDQQITPATCQCATDRGSQPTPAGSRFHLKLGVLGRTDPRAWKQSLEQFRAKHSAEVVGMGFRERV